MLFRFIVVIFILCQVVKSEDSLYLPKNPVVNNTTQTIPLKLDGKPLSMGMACSIALIDQNHLFFCNYASIYWVDLTTGKTKKVNPPAKIKNWFPTGLKYLPKKKILYVANYLGQDVLIFKVSDDHKLKLVRRVIDSELKGPENIDVTKDASYFAVADFDGGRVTLFDKNGKKCGQEMRIKLMVSPLVKMASLFLLVD